jgi:thioredoxin 1
MEIPAYTENARAAIDAGRTRAAGEGKRVAVVFGADWCPDCDAFKKALGHRLVLPIVEPNYVIVKISVGNRDRNMDIMQKYGMNPQVGIPAVAILEPDGSLVATEVEEGFRNSSTLLSVAEIVSFFHRWAPARSEAV